MDLIIFAIRLAEALVSLIRAVIETKTAAPGKRRKADGRKRQSTCSHLNHKKRCPQPKTQAAAGYSIANFSRNKTRP